MGGGFGHEEIQFCGEAGSAGVLDDEGIVTQPVQRLCPQALRQSIWIARIRSCDYSQIPKRPGVIVHPKVSAREL